MAKTAAFKVFQALRTTRHEGPMAPIVAAGTEALVAFLNRDLYGWGVLPGVQVEPFPYHRGGTVDMVFSP